MRTLVDIPEEDLTLMNTLSEAGHVSRAELVQRAIAAYLEPHKHGRQDEGFGLWGKRAVHGLRYEKIRSECKA